MSVRALVVTLGYRHYMKAIKTHLAAAERFQSSGARFDWLTLYGVPEDMVDEEDAMAIVTRKYQQARDVFLSGDYDYFIAIEDDMLIPPNTLEQLIGHLEAGADVVYGLYCWRHGIGGGAWSAYRIVDDYYGESVVAAPDEARELLKAGAVVPVAGVGMGCTAINRKTLTHLGFQKRGNACNDWYFAVDAQRFGYKQVCDFGLVCGHMTLDPTPRIIWPDADNLRTLQRIQYL